VTADIHEQARRLITLAGPEGLMGAEQSWLPTHLANCESCRVFADNAAGTIQALRAIPAAAGRSLVAATQARVRQRALELQRQRERMWLVCLSCIAVTVCALVTTIALWRGFAWVGEQAQVPSSIWQVAFLVFCVTPALVAGILLLARDTHMADYTGSYEG
jgi:predicted anti-sigma-YlaC factor YlaD